MFNKKTTKILAVLLSFIMLGAMATFTYADGYDTPADDPVISEWVNVQSVQFSKSVIGNTLKIIVTITGRPGTTYSNGTLTIKTSSGTQIAKWTGISSTSNSFTINKSITKPSAGNYVASLSITATRNGTSELVEASYSFSIS